ncbi:hypothetical protein DWW91_11030 [Parabacteroides sp. AF17-3]|nr:hypothetical protein DWW91_11030 [Parabacteroides sp. AF17-3]
MSILKKGLVHIRGKRPDLAELQREIRRLPDGEYSFFICDKKPNKTLPRMKYLYAVVLKTISDELPDHPKVEVLYRKFEKMFAPTRTTRLFKNEFSYQDLKNCTSTELDEVIQKIIWFASENLSIKVMERLDFRPSEVTEAYVGAYNEQWEDYNRNI